jgi:hypothetical protein
MKKIEIYFEDLKPEIQEKYKKWLEGSINTNSPICIIEIEEEEDQKN